MDQRFQSVEAAIAALATPSSPEWMAAFGFLAQHPETAELIVATFAETLEQMGVRPTGRDASTGEPVYRPEDVPLALGLPSSALEHFGGKGEGG